MSDRKGKRRAREDDAEKFEHPGSHSSSPPLTAGQVIDLRDSSPDVPLQFPESHGITNAASEDGHSPEPVETKRARPKPTPTASIRPAGYWAARVSMASQLSGSANSAIYDSQNLPSHSSSNRVISLVSRNRVSGATSAHQRVNHEHDQLRNYTPALDSPTVEFPSAHNISISQQLYMVDIELSGLGDHYVADRHISMSSNVRRLASGANHQEGILPLEQMEIISRKGPAEGANYTIPEKYATSQGSIAQNLGYASPSTIGSETAASQMIQDANNPDLSFSSADPPCENTGSDELRTPPAATANDTRRHVSSRTSQKSRKQVCKTLSKKINS